MTDPVIDTSILVDYLRGHQQAIPWLDGLRTKGALFTHAVAAAELLIGARDRRELQQLDAFLATFTIIPANEADSLTAVDYVRRFHLSHGVGLLDCVIAATCVRLGAPVATANSKHFSVFPTIAVIRPY
jgi:predicted nucleic acid-binding protein